MDFYIFKLKTALTTVGTESIIILVGAFRSENAIANKRAFG